jgi:glycerol-3-phosphate acyltransferase PlsX
MIIALDGMGTDNHPSPEIEAAVQAQRERKIKVVVVGDEKKLTETARKHSLDYREIEIVHTSEVITMDDHPGVAIRKKKNSSMMTALKLVKEGKAGAVVSAGNSGAFMGGAIFTLGRLKGVDRPAFVGMMPTMKGWSAVIDMGANVDCKPVNLLQFAVMGSVYSKNMLGIEKPRVGLLSNGTEETKGNELTRAVNEMLKKSNLNYIGYIEGRDIFYGKADVIVCDGFVGNVFLKASEGLAEAVAHLLKETVLKSPLALLGTLLAYPTLKKFKKRWDYSEYGGAPLIGVKGLAIVCHGSSSAKAIKNAIFLAHDYLEKGINDKIVYELHKNEDLNNSDNRSTDSRLEKTYLQEE